MQTEFVLFQIFFPPQNWTLCSELALIKKTYITPQPIGELQRTWVPCHICCGLLTYIFGYNVRNSKNSDMWFSPKQVESIICVLKLDSLLLIKKTDQATLEPLHSVSSRFPYLAVFFYSQDWLWHLFVSNSVLDKPAAKDGSIQYLRNLILVVYVNIGTRRTTSDRKAKTLSTYITRAVHAIIRSRHADTMHWHTNLALWANQVFVLSSEQRKEKYPQETVWPNVWRPHFLPGHSPNGP